MSKDWEDGWEDSSNSLTEWEDAPNLSKELLKKGLMSPFGIKMYEEGLQKKPHDAGISDNPKMPKEMKKYLEKIKKLNKFKKLSPSVKKMHYRRFLRIKRPETKLKFIKQIISALI